MKSLISYISICSLLLTSFSCSSIKIHENKQLSRSPSSEQSTRSCIELLSSFFGNESYYISILKSINHQNHSHEYGLERALDNPDILNLLEKKLKKLGKKKRPISKIRKSAIKIHLLANSKDRFFKSIVNMPLGKDRYIKLQERILRQSWERELLSHDLFTAMENLKLLKDPQNISKLRTIRGDVREMMKGLFYLSFLYTPKVSFSKNKYIPKSIVEELFEVYKKSNYDFSSIRPKLEEIYGTRVKADIVFQSIRTVFILVSIPVILYFVATVVAPWMISDLPDIVSNLPELTERFFTLTIPQLREKMGLYNMNPDDREQMEKELVDNYREAYKAFKGDYPDDSNSNLISKIDYYRDMSDFNLLLEYRNAFPD